MRNFFGRMLDRFPSLRKMIRHLRWQVKKVPLIRQVSIAFDQWYFKSRGAERPDEHQSGDGDDYFESYATTLQEKVSGRVLDLGCGHGFLTRRLTANPKVTEVVAVDKINEFQFPEEKIRFHTQDLSQNSSLPHGFDVIVSSEFVEHITEEAFRKLAKEIGVALNPGGAYIGSTPQNPTPYKVFSGSRFHVREYSEKDLKNLLSDYFSTVSVRSNSEHCLIWEAKSPSMRVV